MPTANGVAIRFACRARLPESHCLRLPTLRPSAPREACLRHQSGEHPHGRILNVGEYFGDASIRLVRDLPVGSSVWKALYHRARNAVESRNAIFEAWGFKRMPIFSLLRIKAVIFLADVLDTLSTLARLVREATLACQVT